jgi:hypothetical protein
VDVKPPSSGGPSASECQPGNLPTNGRVRMTRTELLAAIRARLNLAATGDELAVLEPGALDETHATTVCSGVVATRLRSGFWRYRMAFIEVA